MKSRKLFVGVFVAAAALAACHGGTERAPAPTAPPQLPDPAIFQMLIPDYVTASLDQPCSALSNSDDPTGSTCYEAKLVASVRTDLGIPGEAFLVVHIQESRNICMRSCDNAIIGVIDLSTSRAVGQVTLQGEVMSPGDVSFSVQPEAFNPALSFSYHPARVFDGFLPPPAVSFAGRLRCTAEGLWRLDFEDTTPQPAGLGPAGSH